MICECDEYGDHESVCVCVSERICVMLAWGEDCYERYERVLTRVAKLH